MSSAPPLPAKQSHLTDDFLYFFLRVRKDRIRKVVANINDRYPEEAVEQRARRLIDAQTQLSFLGGLILDLPAMIPVIGHALKILGFVGGTAALVRMHLYLILEIALLYGKDIDDETRVPEMAAVVAGTGVAVGAPFVADVLGFHPLVSMATGGVAALTVSRLIGESAIRYFSQPQDVPSLPALEPSA
ncbi:MAG: hypothetical protein WAK96_06280 [Desulfobaccales bacterium]